MFIFSYSDKGVKVELGIPYELWDKPSVEITNLKAKVFLSALKLRKVVIPFIFICFIFNSVIVRKTTRGT